MLLFHLSSATPSFDLFVGIHNTLCRGTISSCGRIYDAASLDLFLSASFSVFKNYPNKNDAESSSLTQDDASLFWCHFNDLLEKLIEGGDSLQIVISTCSDDVRASNLLTIARGRFYTRSIDISFSPRWEKYEIRESVSRKQRSMAGCVCDVTDLVTTAESFCNKPHILFVTC